jgi:hypothetical protein
MRTRPQMDDDIYVIMSIACCMACVIGFASRHLGHPIGSQVEYAGIVAAITNLIAYELFHTDEDTP